MDKFGIFNILSSLFNGTRTEKIENPASSAIINPPPLTNENAQAEMRATSIPLQNSMLATIKNHDEFVKRVNSKNKKQ